jgi:hypothetical protein
MLAEPRLYRHRLRSATAGTSLGERKERILFVDDEEPLAHHLEQRALKRLGYAVTIHIGG